MKEIVVVCVALAGCGAWAAQEAEAGYLSQQLTCVDQAKTLEESRACRQRVKDAWAKDGGDQ
jgi:hypothetical protein